MGRTQRITSQGPPGASNPGNATNHTPGKSRQPGEGDREKMMKSVIRRIVKIAEFCKMWLVFKREECLPIEEQLEREIRRAVREITWE